MLRAVRFRSQLGFRYAEGLTDAIRARARDLERISAERIRDEFVKILVSDGPDMGLNDLRELGLLERFLPEILDLVGVEQGAYHHLDVWDHTLLVVKGLARFRDPVLSLAGLFHDVAKPSTRSVDAKGCTHFYEHERVGAKLAYGILQRLRFSNETAEKVALLVRHHMRLATVTWFSLPAARRLVRDLKGETDRYFALIESDLAALKPGVKPIDLAGIHETVDQVQREDQTGKWESPLNGEEIGGLLGWEPGPKIGEAKRWLRELVLDGRLAPDDRERAAQLLRERFTREC
jgi:poly(A) polymerase